MVRMSRSQAGAAISLHRNPGVAGAPHPPTFPPSSLRAVLRHGAPGQRRSLSQVWGGILLSAGSTLFWVPILAYVCGALGAPAGLVFWLGFAAVMFGLGVLLWAVVQSGMSEATDVCRLKQPSAQVLSLNEYRSGRARAAQA
jgi:hypothetical protein